MSGGVAGVPCPGARPPSPRPWRALLFSRRGRKPETQTGMREGLVTAARCVDRSVQLVLIPALFLSFPSRCRHVQSKRNTGASLLHVGFSPQQSEFIENILAFFPVPNPPQKREKKEKKRNPAHTAPIFHILCFWNQGIHFHPVSSCFAVERMRPL